MSRKKSIFPVIVLIFSIGMASFGIYQLNKMPESPFPQLQGKFSLHHEQGSYTFEDMAGKSGIIFFGYTHCPDVCPATLINIGKALDMLDKSEQEKVSAVFISLDPERDTPEKVSKYAKYFHPQIIGLTGSREEIDITAKSFYVAGDKNKPNEKGNYTLNHSTNLFIIRPDGALGELASMRSTPEEIAIALRRWLPWAD